MRVDWGEVLVVFHLKLFCKSTILTSFVTNPGSEISRISPTFEYGAGSVTVVLYKTP